MNQLVTEALVLHAFDYLESSRIFRLATRDAGVVSVLARGARTSVKRFGSSLDLFVSGMAQIEVRQGRELQTLSSFDLARARGALALDLDRFAAASMLAELMLRCSAGDAHDTTFQALSDALDALSTERGAAVRPLGVRHAWQLVSALGFAPSVEACASCHTPLSPEAEAVFSHRHGGALCASCEGQARAGRRLPAAARAEISAWLADAPTQASDGPTLRAHARLLREFVEHHVAEGTELRAYTAWAARLDAA
jgi:DNA repair protein RecO (recombination protein O)